MLAPLAALAAAAAPVAPADLAGAWEGTVGTLPVRACFMPREWGTFGAYYYLSQLRLIPLDAEDEGSAAFREAAGSDSTAPRWVIRQAGADRLSAQWTNGTRTLPVQLRRVARMEGDESPCSSAAFHRPRLEGVRTTTSRATLNGTAYTRIALDPRGRFEVSFETFALDGDGEPVRRINAELGRALTGSPPSWFECISDSLQSSAFEGSFSETYAPAMITGRWLSVAHHWDGFCGGAHPDSSNNHLTFELATGRQVDLHDWLNARAVKRERFEGSEEESKTLEPAFREVILQSWTDEDPECRDVVRDEEYWDIGLAPDGLVFSPELPHVVQACGTEVAVPLDQLLPYLTEEGAANLRAVAAEAEPRPPSR